jgi:ligand-binding sensor domain-containing protein
LHRTDAQINRILATRTSVWVATDAGVLKYDRAGERWVTFTVEDGLSSNRVNSILLDGDYIWFGTDGGLTRFYWNTPYRLD